MLLSCTSPHWQYLSHCISVQRTRPLMQRRWPAAVVSETASTELHAKAFQSGVPQAHVVIFPNQNHYVFISDEANVLQLITEVISGVPQS
jgi:hypothetical protein